MGILSNPGHPEKQLEIFQNHHAKLCFLSYFAGIVWFLLLAYEPFNAATYFSENALLPGLVRSEFNNFNEINHFLEDLKTEAALHPNDMPYSFLLAKFTQLGLDTYEHDFTLHAPFDKNSTYKGKNIYAVLRAPRIPNTEAIVLSIPYRPPDSVYSPTLPGIAIMFSLVKYFRKHTYWSKNVVFLITEHEQLGMQAWLEAYHHVSLAPEVLDSGTLFGRSGSIQAAVNLEIPSEKISHVDVKIEGLNGQLPNLDLFNLGVRLLWQENFHPTFKMREDPQKYPSFRTWLHSFQTLYTMMISQATGIPTGNHGLFHRFHIEAITLTGHLLPGARVSSFTQVARVLEGIYRSLNNLLERFHQSFFLYLLPSTTRYISIGIYMPPFALVALGIIIKALALRLETNKLAEKQKEEANEDKALREDKSDRAEKKIDYGLTSTLSILMLTHFIGLILHLSPIYLIHVGNMFNLKKEESVYTGFLSYFLSLIMVPAISNRYSSRLSWQVKKCVALLELALLLFSVSLLNFSLAFIISVIYVPVCVNISPSNARWKIWMKSLFVLLIAPLFLLHFFMIYDTALTFPEDDLQKLLVKSFVATKKALLFSIVDAKIYGNWLFNIGSLVLFPIWLQFWNIVQFKI